MRNKFLLFCLAMLCTTALGAESLDRIEPPCWWVGMHTDLQLMLHGRDIHDAKVTTDASVKGISVTKVTSTDNPDYLFVDVRISDLAKPGVYAFNLITPDGRQFDFDYELLKRRKGSARRESFGPADAVYLLMPDRFANGDPKNNSSSATAEKADPKNLGGRHGGDIQGIIDHLRKSPQQGLESHYGRGAQPLRNRTLVDEEPALADLDQLSRKPEARRGAAHPHQCRDDHAQRPARG